MISGIASLGKGERGKGLGASMWLSHLGAGMIGGAGMGTLVWLLFTPIRTIPPWPVPLVLFLAIAVLAVLAELDLVPLPRQARQVPQWWYARYGPNRSYALYGLWLGAGLATNITYTVEYVVFAAAGLLVSPLAALAAGAAFGFGRTVLVGPIGLAPGIAGWWGRLYADGWRIRLAISSALSIAAMAGIVAASI